MTPSLRRLSVGLLLLAAIPVPGARADESARALLDRGLAAYERGDFEAAVDDFEEILEQGYDDSTVHYDLGNALFKTGRLGRAIWHYRRAHALAPRDADVAANLEYARFLALDRIEGQEARTDRRVEGWLDRVTSAEAFRAAALLWVLAAAAGIAWQLSPRGGDAARRSAAALAVLWALVFTGAWVVRHRAASAREAVVVVPEAQVRSAPGPSFPTAFVLHEGAEVVVEGDRGEWTEISLPGDLRGWIETSRVAKL
jgi:tetratricopeptide (TPR) repeat protein